MPLKDTSLYFIALIPPASISEEITAMKTEIKEKFGAKQSFKSPPHLTLFMPFQLVSKKEESLMRFLANFSSQYQPLTIKTKDFGCFPPGVLFVDIEGQEELTILQFELMSALKLNFQLFRGLYRELAFHPHITIAFRDLKKRDFPQAWTMFEPRTFKKQFIVEHISLLKHNGQFWDVYHQFPFSTHS